MVRPTDGEMIAIEEIVRYNSQKGGRPRRRGPRGEAPGLVRRLRAQGENMGKDRFVVSTGKN